MKPASQLSPLVAAVGRGFFRAVKAFPPLFLVVVAAGLGLGVFLVFFASDPNLFKIIVVRIIGAACLVFYGVLLWLFIARQRGKAWDATCDYCLLLFSGQLNLSPQRILRQDNEIRTGISLRRIRDLIGIYRGLQVFLDGQEIGQLLYGARCSFGALPGRHEIYVRMDWCRSEPLSLTIDSGGVVQLECGCRFGFMFPLNAVGLAAWPERFFFIRTLSAGGCVTGKG